ncbi:MAG: hypothetical protein ACYTBJ_14430 [Planctomycetota bacterium]|jgi:hypothetical protein
MAVKKVGKEGARDEGVLLRDPTAQGYAGQGLRRVWGVRGQKAGLVTRGAGRAEVSPPI